MNYSEKCPFCDGTRYINNKMANLPTTEAILFENEDLYVRVDISPLCLGHCLIITRKHYLNFFEIPIDLKQQVKKIMEKIRSIYKKLYNSDVLFFEHGADALHRVAVDAAHGGEQPLADRPLGIVIHRADAALRVPSSSSWVRCPPV